MKSEEENDQKGLREGSEDGTFDFHIWNQINHAILKKIMRADNRRKAETVPLCSFERRIYIGPGEILFFYANNSRDGLEKLIPVGTHTVPRKH